MRTPEAIGFSINTLYLYLLPHLPFYQKPQHNFSYISSCLCSLRGRVIQVTTATERPSWKLRVPSEHPASKLPLPAWTVGMLCLPPSFFPCSYTCLPWHSLHRKFFSNWPPVLNTAYVLGHHRQCCAKLFFRQKKLWAGDSAQRLSACFASVWL